MSEARKNANNKQTTQSHLVPKKSKRPLNDSKSRAVPSTSGHQKDENESKTAKSLSGKVVFLDIKDSAVTKRIELKLKKLKADIETFLTKEVCYVITSSESLQSKSDSNPRSMSPPMSNTPSPFHANTPSTTPSPTPTYINAKGKVAALSRGQAMAQMARARNRSPSPNTTITNAKRLGIKVITVEAAERWLDKELSKKGLNIQQISPQQADQSRRSSLTRTVQILEPFVKVEACSKKYRPLHKELSVWPHISLATPRGTCPFDGVGVTAAQRSKGASNKEAPASRGNWVSPSTQSNTNTNQRRSLECDESSRLVGVPILTAGDLRRQREKRKQEHKKRGYCECCRIRYDNIEEHLKETKHLDFVRDKSNYEMLDDLISLLPCPSEFLRNTLLRHCSKQQGGKPPASESDPPAVESSSSDTVLTVSERTTDKLPEAVVDGADAANVNAGDSQEEEGRTRNYPGLSTPTYTPQYPPSSQALDSPARGNQDPAGSREDQAGSLNASMDTDGAEGGVSRGVKSQARLSGVPLPAVVIRRQGARSAYGSPRDKWKHSNSPFRRDSSLSPRKVRERSMVFGNTSIASLQSVPEDYSPRTTNRSPQTDNEGQNMEPSRNTEALASQDRSRLGASSLKRRREKSSEPSTPGTVSVTTAVGVGTPHRSDRKRSLKRKRISSLSVKEASGFEASTVTCAEPVENMEVTQEEKRDSEELENDEGKRSVRDKNKSQRSSPSVELLKEEVNEQNESDGEENGAQVIKAQSDYPHLGSPILRHSPRKIQQRTPKKNQDPGPGILAAGEGESTPQEAEHCTPQQSEADEEEQDSPASPVYQPLHPPTSTPTVLVVRKLRSTRSGVLDKDEAEELSPTKSSRRTLMEDEDQLGPSHAPSSTENLASRKSEAVRNIESPAPENEDGVSESKKRALSASKEQHTPQKMSDIRSESDNRGRSEQRGQGKQSSDSQERAGVRSKTRSASRSQERSDSKQQAGKERSRRGKFLMTASSSSSQAHSDTPERKTRSMSNQKRTSKRLSMSKENVRGNEVPVSYCKSSDSCTTEDESSQQTTQTSMSNCSKQTVNGGVRGDADSPHSLRIKLVRSPCTRVSKMSATKKVKLATSWQLLSDHSMSRLLNSDTDRSFDGFHEDPQEDPLPSDLTYISASEVEVTDDEEREWVINEEEEIGILDRLSEREQNESLQEFIPTFSSPGKSNSSWDDACDMYVRQSVEQQLKSRQRRPRSPRKNLAALLQSKLKHASSKTSRKKSRQNEAKKRTQKRKMEDNPDVCSTNTPTKRERGNDILYDSEAVKCVDKDILCSYASPRKYQSSMPGSPLKVLNGDCKNVLPQSPRQLRYGARPSPPAF